MSSKRSVAWMVAGLLLISATGIFLIQRQTAPEAQVVTEATVDSDTPTGSGSTKATASASIGSLPIGQARYAIPDGAIFVSPRGGDGGSGGRDSPYRSVRRAIDQALSGDVIVLRAGSYHESVILPAGKPLTLQAYPGEEVWFDGTSSVPRWERRGSVWVASGWDYRFDSSPTHTRGAPDNNEDGWRFIDARHPMAAHPDMVWLSGKKLNQVRFRSDVARGTFYVDQLRRELVLGSDPDDGSVRASTLQRAITMRGDSGRMRGIGVRGYATSVWQGGALIVQADDVQLENLVISDNATTGLSLAASGIFLERITAERNGMIGINGHQADRLSATKLLVARNNVEQFNIAPAAGGMKVTASREVEVTNSHFDRNLGHGLWFDASCYDVTLVALKTRSNLGTGIRLEISSRALIVGITSMSNGSEGLRIANTDRVEVANNTLARNAGRNLAITTDHRRASSASTPGHDSRRPSDTSMTWVSDQINVYNNVLSAGGGACVVCVFDTRIIEPDRNTVRFDHNYYHRTSPTAPKVFAAWPFGQPEPLRFLNLAEEQVAIAQDLHSFLGESPRGAVDHSGAVEPAAQAAAPQVARGLTPAAAEATEREAESPYLGAWT